MRIKGLIKQFTAGLMIASMLLTIMPSRAVNAEELDINNGENIVKADPILATASDGTAEEERYSVTPNTQAPTFESFKGINEWKDRASYTAPANTYVLTVATGVSKGSTVLYYCVNYKDSSSVSHKQFIFPNLDASNRSKSLLKYYAGKDKKAGNGNIEQTFGQKLASSMNYSDKPAAQAPLSSFSVDNYAFITQEDINVVDSIEVYLERGEWTTQGMAIYKVDKYKGYEEYGVISGQQFLDFEGYLVADTSKRNKTDQLSLSTGGVDKVFNIGKSYNKATIKNYPKNSVKKGFAVTDSLYTFRMDFADTEDGGLESFMNKNKAKMSGDFGITEDIAIEFQYLDTHGWNRKVVLPVLLSGYGEAMKANPDEVIFGYGLRGDTIAFQGLLPEYESTNGETKIYLGNKARSELSSYGVKQASLTSRQSANLNTTDADNIGLSGISLYKGGCMAYVPDGVDNKGNTVEGATMNYVFENKDPMSYYTLMAERGRDIKPGGTDKITFKPYTANSPILATQAASNKYLITIDTSDTELAATNDDVTLRFHYVTYDSDDDIKTPIYHIQPEASKFLAKWPTVDDKDFLTESGLVSGGRVSFVIQADDVRDFTGVEINIAGEDEWIIDNLTIAYLQSADKRYAYMVPTEVAGVKSDYWVERATVSSQMFSLRDFDPLIYDENGNVVTSTGETIKELVVDENGEPILDDQGNYMYKDVEGFTSKGGYAGQFIKGNETYTMSFNTGTEMDIRKKSYTDVRYSMTYDETGVNWGFFKKRKTYEVGVKVAADDSSDTGNGNAGSKNHFYFQLLFENGKSAYVLANQQITSDGFRSDTTETFTISTNQDYGELQKIRIIPEDVSSDSTPYDKLNIERIDVTENTNGGSYLTYLFDSVGWIEIDYHDEGEETSLRSRKARSQEELSHVFEVAQKESRVKILCEVPYLAWDGDYGPFEGSINATVHYTHASNGKADDISFDVVKAMADYMGISAISVEGKTNPEDNVVSIDGAGFRTNTKYMMRPYHTDRFMLPAIADLGSIDSIEFTCTNVGTESSQWVIGNVSLSQVYEDGPIQRNANDELCRNMTVKKLCTKDNETTEYAVLPVGNPVTLKPITFTNKIEWKTETWATPVTRLPKSKDDKVNVYIYPTPGSKNDSNASVDLRMFKYFVPYSDYRWVSQYNLQYINDGRGLPVHYAKGVSVADFVSPSEMTIKCINKNYTFDHAIVQHVRDNTVIDTFTYTLWNASAQSGLMAEPIVDPSYIDHVETRFALSFGPGTPEQNLVPEGRDVAISLTYTSTLDDGKQEYQTPYFYLTDYDITKIQEGTFADITLKIPFIKEIVNYNIAGYGGLEANVRGAVAEVYQIDKQEIDPATGQMVTQKHTKRSYSSFPDRYALTDRLSKHDRKSDKNVGENALMPIAMTFTTSEAVSTGESGTNSSVCMIITYRDDAGVLKTEKFMDISKYIQDEEKTFETDKEKTVKFFLPELNSNMQLLSAKILPYNPIEMPEDSTEEAPDVTVLEDDQVKDTNNLDARILQSLDASWSIAKLYCELGFDRDSTVSRDVNKQFLGLENGGVIRLSNITVKLSAGLTDVGNLTFENNLTNVVGKSNDVVSGIVTIVGSSTGFDVKAQEMIGEAGSDVTADTVKIDTAKNSFTFTAPVNETGEPIIYKIQVIPRDAEDLKYTIMLTVKSDPKKEEPKDASPGDATSD